MPGCGNWHLTLFDMDTANNQTDIMGGCKTTIFNGSVLMTVIFGFLCFLLLYAIVLVLSPETSALRSWKKLVRCLLTHKGERSPWATWDISQYMYWAYGTQSSEYWGVDVCLFRRPGVGEGAALRALVEVESEKGRWEGAGIEGSVLGTSSQFSLLEA